MSGVEVEVNVMHLDEFRDFYDEICDSINYLRSKKNPSVIERRLIDSIDRFDALIERGEDD